MHKSIIKKIFSIVLILSMIMCEVALADNVFVAAAPTNNQASTNGLAGSSILGTAMSVQGVQGIYPGSITGVDDSPKTVVITSPAAHQAAMHSGDNSTKIITNGYDIPVETNYEEPKAVDIRSPGEHMNQMKKSISTDATYDTSNMSYNSPLSNMNSGTSAPGTANVGISTSQNTGNNYPYNNYATTTTGGTATVQSNYTSTVLVQKNTGLPDPVITSDAAIVINGNNNEFYYQKNAVAAFAPAGLTTILTGYIALQSRGLDDLLVVNASAVTGLESGANTVGLKAGDTITLRDALHAMYIKSACDAANVIAENVAGSQAAFVNLMNQTAKSFGTLSTNFANCNGLNNAAQVTTAYDMALIMNHVTNNAVLNYLLAQTKYTLPATAHRKALTITSKNTMLTPGSSTYYTGITCSRLGYTSKAKYTMASLLMYNGQKIIAVVLHSNNSQFVDTKRMFNFGKTVVDRLGLKSTGVSSVQTVQSTQATQAMLAAQAAQLQAQQNAQLQAQQAAQYAQVVSSVQATQQTTNTSSTDTAGSWQKDSNGWMFIKSDGQKVVNGWVQSGGKRYCIDQSGYMITGWREFSNGSIYYFDPNAGDMKFNTWVNTSSGAYFLQVDGSLARASKGQEQTISTPVGNYVIDDTGKALRKVK